MALPLIAFAGPAPLVVVILAGFVAGVGIEIFGVLWDTAMQQEISGEKLSRLSAYDMLGSLVLIPIALATAGPIAQVIGQRETFLGAAVLIVVMTGLVLLSRDVRDLQRRAA